MESSKQICLDLYRSYLATRDEILTLVSSYSEEQRNQAASDGGWSINQIIEHLLVAEKGILGYMMRKTQDPSQLLEPKFKNRRNATLLIVALKTPIKFKAPKNLSSPKSLIDSEELDKPWMKVGDRMQKFLDKMNDDVLSKCIFRHPKAGLISGESTFKFMKAHIERHSKQLYRGVGQL